MHTFSTSTPQVELKRTAPFAITFTLTPPAGWHSSEGQAVRLLHLRTGPGAPRETEVAELKRSANGMDVVETCGLGLKKRLALPHPEGTPPLYEPLKFTPPGDGRYTVTYGSDGVSVNGHAGQTMVRVGAGQAVELLFGFDGATESLAAPIGWTLDLEGEEVAPVPTPPAPTPAPHPEPPPAAPPPAPAPTPSPVPPGTSAQAAFVADLEALLLKYAAVSGVDPLVLGLLPILIDRLKR